MRSLPFSVKNGRGDVIYRHGCQITGSSCGEGDVMHSLCFLSYLIAAQRSGSTVLCFVMQRVQEGQDMTCFPLCSQARKLHHSPGAIFSSASFLLFFPSSLSAYPSCSHSQLVTYGSLVKTSWCNILTPF